MSQNSGGLACMAVVAMLARSGFGSLELENSHSLMESAHLFGATFWGLAVFTLNWGVLQGLGGQSLGKMLFEIQVVCKSGAPLTVPLSMGRSFLYFVSSIPLWLGFLAIFLNKEARCIHDWICGTWVVDSNRQAAALRNIPVESSKALVATVIQLPSRLESDRKKKVS